jgi:hypothetical protein
MPRIPFLEPGLSPIHPFLFRQPAVVIRISFFKGVRSEQIARAKFVKSARHIRHAPAAPHAGTHATLRLHRGILFFFKLQLHLPYFIFVEQHFGCPAWRGNSILLLTFLQFSQYSAILTLAANLHKFGAVRLKVRAKAYP